MDLFAEYAKTVPEGSVCCDLGSGDYNGCLRPLFSHCLYTGVDQEKMKNVDVVMEDPFKIPFEDGHFDVVLSANMFEHCAMPWKIILEIARITKPRGEVFLHTPWTLRYHPYPKDYFRMSHDAFDMFFGPWLVENGMKPFETKRSEIIGMDTVYCGVKPMV